jgi:hypothetical protein
MQNIALLGPGTTISGFYEKQVGVGFHPVSSKNAHWEIAHYWFTIVFVEKTVRKLFIFS